MGPEQVAGVILAAGSSTRAGAHNKLLLSLDGKPMVRRAVEAALGGGLDPVVLVTGHEETRVREAVTGLAVRTISNPRPDLGMSRSLAVGLGALPAATAGAAVLLGDMPWVGPAHVARLVAAFRGQGGGGVCVPTFRGRRGNPVVWSAGFFDEMAALEGDVGARGLLARHTADVLEVEMDDSGVLRDVDTLEEWRRAEG